jgi:c-di-GMP-binding flagellar brake protein YcgR
MDSPQRPERRDIRYPLHLPVSLKVADKELRTRSENISLGGILLSSAFQIPEGSTVEVAFGVVSLPDSGTQSSVSGKVLRVRPKATGDFAVAIAFEHPFRDGLQGPDSGF